MSKKLQLSVPKPCHENWDNMTPVEKGRFCGSCQKQVVDFSNMSDRGIAMFFKKKSTGSVCGRFFNDQLDRDIEIPKKRIPWLKYFFQFLIPAFLISCRENLQGKVKVSKVEVVSESEFAPTVGIVIVDDDIFPANSDDTIGTPVIITQGELNDSVVYAIDEDSGPFIEVPVLIKGIVVDEENKAIPYANIKSGMLPFSKTADKAGYFSIPLTPDQNIFPFKLQVDCIGYKSRTIDYLVLDSSLLKIQLEKDIKNLDTVVVSANVYTRGSVMITGQTICKKTSESQNDNNIPTQMASLLNLYPNPVQKGSVVTIDLKNETGENLQVKVFSLDGRMLLSQTKKTVKGNNRFTVQADSKWVAGTYLVQLLDAKGKTLSTEKLIIQ